MKPLMAWIVSCVFAISIGSSLHAEESVQTEDTQPKWLVILSVTTDFEGAEADARKFSKATGVPFTLRGLVYDSKKGLVHPPGSEPEWLAGEYTHRSHNYAWEGEKELTDFISIEKSDSYPGLKPGFYIVVAGIEESPEDAKKVISKFQSTAPKAYIKKTQIFLGCSA